MQRDSAFRVTKPADPINAGRGGINQSLEGRCQEPFGDLEAEIPSYFAHLFLPPIPMFSDQCVSVSIGG